MVKELALRQVVSTLWSGNGLLTAEYFAPLHDGSFVVAGPVSAQVGKLVRVQPDGSHTTICVGSPLMYPQGILQDLSNGHLVVCDLYAESLFDVTLGGQVTTLWKSTGSLMAFFCITQDHLDGSLIIGPGTRSQAIGVVRWDRRTCKPSTLGTPHFPFNSTAICFDRSTGTGPIVTGAGPVYRISRTGQMMSTIKNLPLTSTGLCFDRGRNIVTRRIGAPNHWNIQLDFPNWFAYNYLVGISMTGFTPGLRVDSRVIPLEPDILFQLTMNGSLDGSLLKGRVGVLGPGGRATATLDLRMLGNKLTGKPIWIAAAVIDGSAPNGLAVISKPVILPLD